MSEFERGYNAGRASCTTKSSHAAASKPLKDGLWRCAIKSDPSPNNTSDVYNTRAEALRELFESTDWKRQQVYAGNVNCWAM